MTAHALVEERQRCLDAGMNDHVSKPIDPDNLLSTLTRWAKPRPLSGVELGVKSAAPPAPIKSADEVTLPEIAGVNIADGLMRVAGNRQLYRDLLRQFAAKQADAAAQISTALESGDQKLAERIAHTVKGVAGTIGITKVQSAAQKVEKAIREGEDSVSALLEEFAQLLGTQVHTIEAALRESTRARPDELRTMTFNKTAAFGAIGHLKTLLEANDGDSGEAFRVLQGTVGGAVEKQYMDALGALVNDFDFEVALVRLDEIAEHCGLHAKEK
jgi:HPt (histidine-containing phosphotransfer) domain-containing protein